MSLLCPMGLRGQIKKSPHRGRWSDLIPFVMTSSNHVYIVCSIPKGVFTVLKHVYRVKKSPYLYSARNFPSYPMWDIILDLIDEGFWWTLRRPCVAMNAWVIWTWGGPSWWRIFDWLQLFKMPTSKKNQQERWYHLTWPHLCFPFRLKTDSPNFKYVTLLRKRLSWTSLSI